MDYYYIFLEILFKPRLADEFRQMFRDQPVFMWSAVFIMALMVIYFGFNYFMLSRIQKVNLSIKVSIEKDLNLFENSLKAQRWIGIAAMIIFILIIEFGKKLSGADFTEWYAISPVKRVLLYLCALPAYYIFAKVMFRRQFGQHIDFLKNVLAKTN